MRASEIRNLLIQKYGVQPAEVAKILDKNELKEMLASLLAAGEKRQIWTNMASNIVSCLYAIFVIIMLFFAARPMIGALSSIHSKDNKTLYKIRLMWSQAKKRRVKGVIYLLVSLIFEFLSFGMSASVLLSWILTANSPYRRYMIPTLSFPVNAGALRSVLSGSSASQLFSQGGSDSGFGLDIGPMLTISGVNWLVSRLEEMSASVFMSGKRRKQSTRSDVDISHRSAGNSLTKHSDAESDEAHSNEHPLRWRKNPLRPISISQRGDDDSSYKQTKFSASCPEEFDDIPDDGASFYVSPDFEDWD